MHRTGRLIVAACGWAWCLAVGELIAQQPQQQRIEIQSIAPKKVEANSRLNANSQKRPAAAMRVASSGKSPSTTSAVSPVRTPVEESSYIGVIGAVAKPGVYRTRAPSIPLKTLVESAGGETTASMGSVRILERGITRFSITLRSAANRPITSGQIIFVIPRGGHDLRRQTPQSIGTDRWIMISGITREPARLYLGPGPVTLAEVLNTLGQPADLFEQGQIVAVAPQGTWTELDTPLVADTVIHFEPNSIDRDGVARGIQRGLNIQPPIDLEVSSGLPSAEPPPEKPVIRPGPIREIPNRPAPVRSTLILPSAGSSQGQLSDRFSPRVQTGIEPTGSSTTWPEPNLFPSAPRSVEEPIPPQSEPTESASQPSGRTPILLPRDWAHPSGDQPPAEDAEVDPARVIHRTSAGKHRPPGPVVTAAAEYSEATASSATTLSAESTSPATSRRGSRIPTRDVNDVKNLTEQTTSEMTSFVSPQSWAVMSIIVAVALGSVLMTRHISQDAAATSVHQELLASHTQNTQDSAEQPVTVAALEVQVPVEDQHRQLQRLILNKVPVIEEAVIFSSTSQLHGQVIGGKRLVVHEPQPVTSGPHFRVRPPTDTRSIELQLRRVMRNSHSNSPRSTQVSGVQAVNDQRGISMSALERALRAVEGESRP